jgi:hypothetical protein
LLALFSDVILLKWTFFRSQKVAGTMQALLGGDEMYHYHSKVIFGAKSFP